MSDIREIVVISGKGGTGKTSISAALAMVAGTEIVLVDCDVDVPDLHLIMSPQVQKREDFYAGELAEIDGEKCIGCGVCQKICVFGAVQSSAERKFSIDSLKCEGCGYCARVCRVNAIANYPRLTGEAMVSTIKTGTKLVHANLSLGGENSGKLVAELKKKARVIAEEEGKDFILVDGSPGIGCPVVSGLSGASLVLLVVEPTVSGFHDLRRVLELVQMFSLHATAIINKADVNPKLTHEMKEFFAENEIEILGEFAYDTAFSRSLSEGKTIVEAEQSYLQKFEKIYEKIKKA